jgi:CRISPR-associated protein Csd1
LLGRLFAVLEKSQYDALGSLNSSIVDKYLNSAMATPQNVFPMLLTLAEKHISKYQKEKKIKISYTKKLIGTILESIPPDGFPQTMNSEDQGRFMIGYYHQRQQFFIPKSVDNATGQTDEQIAGQIIIENGGNEND